jgi:hypothetical protein
MMRRRKGSWSTRTEVEEEEVAGGGRYTKRRSGDSRFPPSSKNRLLRQSTFSFRFRLLNKQT